MALVASQHRRRQPPATFIQASSKKAPTHCEAAVERKATRNTETGGESRRLESSESELRTQCETLQKRFERLNRELNDLKEKQSGGIARLQEALGHCERDLEVLPLESERKTRKLERENEVLEQVREKNERTLEAQESDRATLQSRIDELTNALDTEREKFQSAEQEIRRLSIRRSKRITFLAQQQEETSVRVKQLQAENDRFRDEDSRLREVAASAENTLRETDEKLIAKSNEIAHLQTEFDAVNSQATARHSECVIANEEIERLTARAEEADRRLHECQQQLQHHAQSMTAEETEFAITQRDRTISLLEKETSVIQRRLQREACARRKAEGVIKRSIADAGLDKELHDAWIEMHGHDQVERLRKQIKALRSQNLLTHQE